MKKGHDNSKYFVECRAKATLETIYPDEFSGLSKDEKPDWVAQDDNLGVEVVQATNRGFREGRALFTNILSGEKLTSENKKYVKKIIKLGQNIQTMRAEDGEYAFAHCATVFFDKTLVLNVIGKKIDRINENCDPYKSLAYLGLYVISSEASLPTRLEEVDEIGNDVYALQHGKAKQFTELFLEDGDVLYRYDLRTRLLRKQNISISSKQKIFVKACLEAEALCKE